MSTLLGSWLRRRRATVIEPPEQLLDRAIAEHEALHAELRQAALRLLYLQAKLEDEARGYRHALARCPHHQLRLREHAVEAERQLAPIRTHARGALQALAQSADEIAALRRERLTALALRPAELPSAAGAATAARDQLALAEAQRELEAALSA